MKGDDLNWKALRRTNRIFLDTVCTDRNNTSVLRRCAPPTLFPKAVFEAWTLRSGMYCEYQAFKV